MSSQVTAVVSYTSCGYLLAKCECEIKIKRRMKIMSCTRTYYSETIELDDLVTPTKLIITFKGLVLEPANLSSFKFFLCQTIPVPATPVPVVIDIDGTEYDARIINTLQSDQLQTVCVQSCQMQSRTGYCAAFGTNPDGFTFNKCNFKSTIVVV